MADFPPPLYGTPRNPSAPTRSGPVFRTAREMGLQLMPWQRHVLDVALEERPDGRLKYDEVNLTVPRQNGKTTTIVPLTMLIVLTQDNRAIAYSAQGISEALQKWRYEMMPKLEKSPIGKGAGIKYLKSIGLAGVECTKTGSVLRVLPSNESTGHGPTICMAIHDEAWAALDSTREQAYKPAMITIDDAQYWVMSVAGTVDSTYLRSKVVAGRRIVKDGRSEEAKLAYFEWAVPEDDDWRDRSLWGPANPALGHTIDMDRLIALSESMAPDDFRRHHLNQWPVVASEWAIPEPAWERARTQVAVPAGPFWAAADAPSPHRGDGAIAVCAGGVLEIIDTGSGSDWAGEKLRALAAENVMDLEGIALWRHGQLKNLGDELLLEGIPVAWMSGTEMPQACGRFYEAVVNNLVGIRPAAALDSAVRRAEVRDRDSGLSTWRSRDGKSISALWAAAMAFSKSGPAGEDEDELGPAITSIDDFDQEELDQIKRELGL